MPTHGTIFRIFASRLPSVTVAINDEPNDFGDTQFTEGKLRDFDPSYLSPLQPYAVYIPSSYDPATPVPMTFALHGFGGEYFWINEENDLTPILVSKLLGEDRNSIVLSPAARGARRWRLLCGRSGV